MCDYDAISIGSGPFILVRMINEILNGRKVAIFEKNNNSGGVWSCIHTMGAYHDAVAHLISPFPKAHEILKSVGINLRPRPIYFWHFRNKITAFKNANFLENVPLTNKNNNIGFLLEWHQHYSIITKTKQEFFQTFESQKDVFNSFRYLDYNFSEITNRLESNFIRLGGIQFLNEKVNTVKVKNKLTVTTEKRTITSNHLISGRHAIADFFVNEKLIKTPIIENPYYSLLVKFASSIELKYEYINVIGHPMIGAIQIERTKDYFESKRIYVCCFVTNEIQKNESINFANKFMEQLFELGILESYTILKSAIYKYKSYSMNTDSCNLLNNKSNGLLEILPVYSIGENISQYSDLWQKALSA